PARQLLFGRLRCHIRLAFILCGAGNDTQSGERWSAQGIGSWWRLTLLCPGLEVLQAETGPSRAVELVAVQMQDLFACPGQRAGPSKDATAYEQSVRHEPCRETGTGPGQDRVRK